MPRKKYFAPDYESTSVDWSPNWRIRRAAELFRQYLDHTDQPKRMQVSRWKEGKAVVRYFRYLKAKRLGHVQERRQAKFLQAFADIASAAEIDRSPSEVRLELRLRIFAGQPLELISNKMLLNENVVRAYCCYQFDVQHVGHKNRYLLDLPRPDGVTPMIATGVGRLASLEHFEHYLVRYLRSAGTAMIDPCLDVYRHFGEPHDLTTPEGRNRESMELRFLAHVLAATQNPSDLCNLLAFAEHINQSSSYGDGVYCSSARRYLVEKMFKSEVQSSHEAEDFDSVQPRQAARQMETCGMGRNLALSQKPVKTNWEPSYLTGRKG